MKTCCEQTAAKFFAANYPLERSIDQDGLRGYLFDLCQKWGKITYVICEGVKQDFYVRSTSSRLLGVNAQTGFLKCDGCGNAVPFIFLGRRLYYFIWRINMVCATYFTTQGKPEAGSISFSGSPNWPGEDQLEQVRIAFEMYFGDDPFLSTQGLAELNQQIFQVGVAPAVAYLYVVDFAELFVLFHEIQHEVPLSHLGPKPIGVSVMLPRDLKIQSERADCWIAELNHDANSLYLLLLSAGSVFLEKFGMPLDDAKMQAASLVCAGADAALHTLQKLEEEIYGDVDVNSAATHNAFDRHPPAGFRRNVLSQESFSLVTGKNIDSLYKKEFTKSWETVAQNVASHSLVRDRLFNAYEAWRHPK